MAEKKGNKMIELGVIIALVVLLGFQEWQNRKERAKLINAVLSKNASEMASLEFVDKVKPEDTKPVIDPMVSTADMSDEEFDKYIQEQIKNG